jgi:pimeloyl-[acyl-carrier protein] methyl ester esterase
MVGHESCPDQANLVLIHGWGYDNSCWPDGLVAQLERHFNVILLALPGHGGASEHVLNTTDGDDCVDQLDAWLDVTKAQLPNRYHVLGWSLGGQVAIRLAHNNNHVDRLILLATNAKFVRDHDWQQGMGLELLIQFVEKYQAQPGKTMRRFASLQALGCEQSKTLAAHLVEHMAPESSKLLGLKLLHTLDERAHLKVLTKPCLIELATDDQLVPKDWVEKLMLAPTCKVNLVAGGHAYVLQSETLAARVIAFLSPSTAPVMVSQ